MICVRGNRIAIGLSPRVRGNQHDPYPSVLLLRVYPRVCGGTKPFAQDPNACTEGSIPACAGEPHDPQSPLLQVYPRVCGGTRPRLPAKS